MKEACHAAIPVERTSMDSVTLLMIPRFDSGRVDGACGSHGGLGCEWPELIDASIMTIYTRVRELMYVRAVTWDPPHDYFPQPTTPLTWDGRSVSTETNPTTPS
jgi:hypothetical protein